MSDEKEMTARQWRRLLTLMVLRVLLTIALALGAIYYLSDKVPKSAGRSSDGGRMSAYGQKGMILAGGEKVYFTAANAEGGRNHVGGPLHRNTANQSLRWDSNSPIRSMDLWDGFIRILPISVGSDSNHLGGMKHKPNGVISFKFSCFYGNYFSAESGSYIPNSDLKKVAILKFYTPSKVYIKLHLLGSTFFKNNGSFYSESVLILSKKRTGLYPRIYG